MRQKSFKMGCMLLVLMLFLGQFEQSEAKAKSPKSEKELKQEWAERINRLAVVSDKIWDTEVSGSQIHNMPRSFLII